MRTIPKFAAALVLGVSLGVMGCSSTKLPAATTAPGTTAAGSATTAIDTGVTTFEIVGNDHVPGTVDYPMYPPVGGDHNPVWAKCGVYTEPLVDEKAVHSLEHGAAWIMYRPDLTPEQVKQLAALAGSYVLISPAPAGKLDVPVVGSGWGLQKRFTNFDLASITAFVKKYANGPQTPEKGASC